jgi:hypothetical protein
MLRTNERGEIITIENVFHSLTTRLSLLKNGLKEWGDIEYDFKAIMQEIESQIYGYESSKALSFINISKNSIKQIELSGKIVFRNLTDSWGYNQVDEDNYFQGISIELNYYTISLELMERELVEIESHSTELFNVNNSDKIPINISIPRLSWLVHFMVGENGEFDKLFSAEKRSFCKRLIMILKHPTGGSISLNSICDKWSDEPSMKASLEFWIDTFGKYQTKCNRILREKGFV